MRHYCKRLKKATSLMLSTLLAVGTISVSTPIRAAESFFEDFEASGTDAFILSKDGGATIAASGDNHYLNISPKSDGIEAFAEYSFSGEDNVPVEFSYRFRVNSYMQAGQTVAYISKSGVPSIVIETYDGGLAYKDGSGNFVKFVEKAVANRWYSIYIRADYTKFTFSVRLDGTDVARNVPVLNGVTGVDKISFRANSAPGIGVDDFSTGVKQNPGEIEVNGDTNIDLAYDTATDVEYVVAVYDTNDAAIDSPPYTASVLPAGSGVTVSTNGRVATVHVSEGAAEGNYTLRIIYGSSIKNFHFTISRYTAQVKSLAINGPGRVAYIEGKENTHTYSVTAYDQNGEEVAASVNYTLGENVPANLSLNPTTGVLTVTGDLKNNTHITIEASCVNDSSIVAWKKVLLQDAATYEGDETRFRILLDYIDRARAVGRDPYNGTKLLAKAIDRYTMKPAIWDGMEYDFVPSNLAEQGNWFRTMEGLYRLTGDPQYKQEIDETYDMYLDNYTMENGTMIMGGHACVDLQTLLPHYGYGAYYLELKTHFPYMEPFWEKNPEAARRFAIKFWDGAVTNWETLAFNRHISLHEAYTEAPWKNLSQWKKPEWLGFNPVVSNGVSFRETGSDLVQMATQLYKNTGEKEACEWAWRTLYNYYAATSPETKLSSYIFNTRYGYRNNYEYDELPEYWWMQPNLISSGQLSWYGDRFYVQYFDDMVEKGLIEDVPYDPYNRKEGEPMPAALEAFYRSDAVPDTLTAYADLEFAEELGFNTEEGQMILDYTLTSLKSLYQYGEYSPVDNKINELLVDGTSLTGYVAGRYGYYGNKGKAFERYELDADFAVACLKTYLTCKDMTQFKDQLYYVWQFVRGNLTYNGFGEAGISAPGDNVKLDFSTESADPRHIILFCQLYDATGNTDYLDMARLIANNVVRTSMVDGLFTYQPDSHYIEIAGRNGVYPYAFALLEATIRGESDLMPRYYVYQGYYEDRGILENTGERRTNLHDVNMWNRYNVTAVHITDIIVPEEEINLKVGEEKFLNISFEPDDATNKSVRITSSNPACVSVDESAKSVVGIKPGSVEIRIISSNNKLLRKTIKVTVE